MREHLPTAERLSEIYGSARAALKYLDDPMVLAGMPVYWAEADDILCGVGSKAENIKARELKKSEIHRRRGIIEELKSMDTLDDLDRGMP